MHIARKYDDLKEFIVPGTVTVIFGPRQVGKTTLVRTFLEDTKLNSKFVLGDNILVSNILSIPNLKTLSEYVNGLDLLVIDEAQAIPNIGQSLKLLTDTHDNLSIIATGSSSFELAGQVGEPLVGRKQTLTLYPVSQLELSKNLSKFDQKENLADFLIYGSYPRVLTEQNIQKREDILLDYISSFLLKDILALEKIKSPKLIFDVLKLIAYQIGGEVSLSELGRQLSLDYKTVGRYLEILEKGFVLHNVRGYSKNLRKEISKKSKYYFWDNGVRNAIISNFNKIEDRNDIGQLFENFLVMERIKYQSYLPLRANNYFWRTWEKHEVDWVEERGGGLFGYEFKYSKDQSKAEKVFKKAYPEASLEIINKENYLGFIT